MKPRETLIHRVVEWTIVFFVWTATVEAKTLPVPLVTQEQDQWCWAAVSKSVLAYHRVTAAQCEIAEYTRSVATWHSFGSTNCCVNPNAGCNYWNYGFDYAGGIEDILTHWGLDSYADYPLSKDAITISIFWDQCFIIRWGWSSGGGHFIVGRGFDGTTLEYMDPWYGEGYKAASYEWVVSGGGHTWTYTLPVPANCDCWAVNQCCNGCMILNESGQCDDGNMCTRSDSCASGTCRGLDPVVCAELDQCHDAGVCDSGTGVCSNPPKGNGSPCNDGDGCTNGDSCQGGACVGGAPVVCPAPDQCHEAGVCDPGTGCSNPPKEDNSPCDDGDACTTSDGCRGGTCIGGAPVVCTTPDQCYDASCDPTSGCTTFPKANSSPCDDGNACTSGEMCWGGACDRGVPVVCAALDQCHEAGVCDPGTGACSNPPKGNGTGCDDGSLCTNGDSCQEGVCVSGPAEVCAAASQCHEVGVCDPGTGVCSNPPKRKGSPCDDGDLCTKGDSCQEGACISGAAVDCAEDQCQFAGCDPLTGECWYSPKSDGESCDDGNDLCTKDDTCQAGVCLGVAVDCNDSDPCTSDICDPGKGGCSNPPIGNGMACDDGNSCTSGESCQGDVCSGGEPVVCQADQCHDAGVCYPLVGGCARLAKADGTQCDDGDDRCTKKDTCQKGVCQGVAVDCNDSNACTGDSCDSATGCRHDPLPDGSECGPSRVCQQGACVGVDDGVVIVGGCGTTGDRGMAAEMGALLLLSWIALGLARRRRSLNGS